jgi:hypothetical protein
MALYDGLQWQRHLFLQPNAVNWTRTCCSAYKKAGGMKSVACTRTVRASMPAGTRDVRVLYFSQFLSQNPWIAQIRPTTSFLKSEIIHSVILYTYIYIYVYIYHCSTFLVHVLLDRIHSCYIKGIPHTETTQYVKQMSWNLLDQFKTLCCKSLAACFSTPPPPPSPFSVY